MYLRSKIDDRLGKVFNTNGDTFIKNIYINKEIEDKLLPYQILHVINLLTALDINNVVTDCSDTGTGKTYTAIAISKQRGFLVFVICPKAAITTWQYVCKYFGVVCVDIVNYERITSKYPNWPNFDHPNYKNIIFIFDEVHKCKNHKTINGNILMKTKQLHNKKIMISATLVDKITDFSIFGYMLGFYKSIPQGRIWVNRLTQEYRHSMEKSNPLKDKLFPYKGSKMSVKEIDDFPVNKIVIHKLVSDSDHDDATNLADIIKLRQVLELKKVEEFFNLTVDSLDNDLSVVVFFNFLKSMQSFAKMLSKKKINYTLLHGELPDTERETNIDQFQKNIVHVIICTFGAGGASVSLHDLYGRARVSILSLPESSLVFTQSLGRLLRAGSKSTPIQYIPIYSKTYERVVYTRIKNKLKDSSQICCDFCDVEFN